MDDLERGPQYFIGSPGFLKAVARVLAWQEQRVYTAADWLSWQPPCWVETFDGLVGWGETPAAAFSHLVASCLGGQLSESARDSRPSSR